MKTQGFLDVLSEHLKNVLAKSISIAQAMHMPEVFPAHILLALIKEPGALASEICKKHTKGNLEKVLLSMLAARIPHTNTENLPARELPELSLAAKRVLERAMATAYEYEHTFIGTEHLLSALLSINDPDIEKACKEAEANTASIESDITHTLEGTSRFPSLEDIAAFSDDMRDMMQHMIPPPREPADDEMPKRKQSRHRAPKNGNESVLHVFTTELTAKIAQEKIDPVIGREEEIERVITIVSRRNKNNPVLVGEPGVGKTAIVEGLAKRISEGRVPDTLKNKKIFSLDLALLISGTIYRGEFESRLKQLIDELSHEPNAILFIDELHNIIGAGSNQGTMDAANILKPALARGVLHCIGATTIDEYKKYISADPALERRFQPVSVEEPSIEDAQKILSGVAPYYENFHHVRFTEDAVRSAVTFASRYIHDNFLPDKALDLLDESAAGVRIRTPMDKDALARMKDERRVALLEQQKAEAIAKEAFDDAVSIKAEIEKTRARIKKYSTKKTVKKTLPTVSAKDIAHVVSQKLHIATDVLLSEEWDILKKLPQLLETHIVGQDHVLKDITKTIERSVLGITHKQRPRASFLFAGPSGVGKTALAKALAKELYHDEKALIRIDMSEFGEAHGVSKLLGSPAGYVGYKERNRFLDDVRHRPYAVVLFDECDKAHPDVRKLLLQILDEGVLKDSTGKAVSFKHAIIILTANTGSQWYKAGDFGFGKQYAEKNTIAKERNARIRTSLADIFGETVLGRLDTICYFEPLSKETLTKIVMRRVAEKGSELHSPIALKLDTEAMEAVLSQGFHSDTGMRNMEQAISSAIYDALSIHQQKKQKKTKKIHTLSFEDNRFVLR